MLNRIFLSAIFLSIFSVNALAQAGPNTQTAVKLSTSSDNFDPLGLLETDDEPDGKPSTSKITPSASTSAFEKVAFDIINRRRAAQGLPALKWCDQVAAVARRHSEDMAEFQFFSHKGLDNKMVSDRADTLGVGRWRAIGENIAFNRGYKDPIEKAVESWLDSPSHRRNMLDANWQDSAVGIAVSPDGSFYFTQVFLMRK
ncbi:MAG: CAP domain-containing protein [Pyrinomonadaceae bacterium]